MIGRSDANPRGLMLVGAKLANGRVGVMDDCTHSYSGEEHAYAARQRG
jgi:hypothetical protein